MESGVSDALAKIERPGSFVVRRELPASVLGLTVRGIGPVTFPLSAAKAQKLCSVGRLAQYGFKNETRLDRRVRDTWEIPRSRITTDRRWNEALSAELEHIRAELGLPSGSRLRAELHNLLVYAPGQFFVPHQDTEKEDGMIGTLIVTLPSKFSGGVVLIKHHDERAEFRADGSGKMKLGLVAFYADCHHEVRPVRAGYRVVLTYNLVLARGRDRSDAPVPARKLHELEARVREFFSTPAPPRWSGAKPGAPPDRLVYLLDHQYSRKGLTWPQLKNADAVRVEALREVAERLDCEVALAQADVHETWSCEYEGYDEPSYGRGHGYALGGRRGYDDDDEEDGGIESAGDMPGLGDLQNSEVELRPVGNGRGVDIAGGYAKSAELCYTKPSADLDPFRSEHEGYMGNWGNTVDRWYHRAAIVLWPRERLFLIRAKESAPFAIDELTRILQNDGLDPARRKAEQLAPFWEGAWNRANDSRLVGKTLRVALALDSPDLALAFILPVNVEDLTAAVGGALVEFLDRYGCDVLEQALQESRGRWRVSHDKHLAWLSSIQKLVRVLVDGNSRPARTLARRLVEDQWEWLAELQRSALRARPSAVLKALEKLEQPLLRLMESSSLLGDHKLRSKMQAFVGSVEYPVLALSHLLATARRGYSASELAALDLAALEARCASELARRLAAPARSRDDWSIALPSQRCSCPLCRELGRFLAAPDRTTVEWPLSQDKRAHIEQTLEERELPVRHTTTHRTRPYTLVLVKTRALFEREEAERALWQRGLNMLESKHSISRARTKTTTKTQGKTKTKTKSTKGVRKRAAV